MLSVEVFGVSEAEIIREALGLALRDDPYFVPRTVRLAAVEAILRDAQQVVETSQPTRTGHWRREDVYEEREQKLCQRLGRGDVAEAEPAVPGWSMAVDELFR